LVAVAVLPIALAAQSGDSLNVGDRVRVRIAATRGANTSEFVGNVASISAETLTVTIPGDKGLVTVPRSAIAEVAQSRGRQSHLTNVVHVAPLALLSVPLFMLPTLHGPGTSRLNTERYILIGLQGLLIGHALARKPPERWVPAYSWLEHP
jgi:preprotein translocase subunit YajC